ncbi:hypothetical protein CEP52_016247 [Fusarium oligoseptatum]|uniref:Uncharacterized protein n=1 Tax=Fusarium oligoseptatum TaxID=2604345 RepID=A0A428S5I3_9HYPO|nr:hypothetical protein CEP52_016247 [Fusarium oligoseptatum]
MATLIKLPPEVLRQIVLFVHDGTIKHRFAAYEPPLRRYELKGTNFRSNLSSLRQVNRLFHGIITPILFQHVVICYGSGTQRLQQLSKSLPLRQLVRRLEICIKVRPVENFGDYLQGLKQDKKKILRYLSQLAVVIHTTLPRFSNVRVIRVNFEDIAYNLNLDPNPWPRRCCWEEDTGNLFESLATALRRSQLNKLDELDLSFPLAYDFGCFLEDVDTDDYSSKALFKKLKYLRIHSGRATDDGEGIEFRYQTPNQEFDKYIRQLLHLAPNVHSLALKGSDFLVLDDSAFPPLHLQSLNLQSLSATSDALVSLVQQSPALERVIITGVYLESGTWKDILVPLSQSAIMFFYIETCGYQMEGESAHFRPADFADHPDAPYIETTEADDIDACEAVFRRVRENKKRKYGSDYDEAADIQLKEDQRELVEFKTRVLYEYVKRQYNADEATDAEESGDYSDSMTDSESEDSDFV